MEDEADATVSEAPSSSPPGQEASTDPDGDHAGVLASAPPTVFFHGVGGGILLCVVFSLGLWLLFFLIARLFLR